MQETPIAERLKRSYITVGTSLKKKLELLKLVVRNPCQSLPKFLNYPFSFMVYY